MVGSISSNSMVMPQQTAQQSSSSSSSLTEDQLKTISSVLGELDSSNLSESDAQSIVKAFEEAGIEPSEDLAKAMEAEGFDAKTVGDTAGMGGGQGGMPPPPPPGIEQEESDVSSLLDSLLYSDEEDEESTTTSSLNEVMEYTSRILNLNESSKTEVLDMLEKYTENESDYSEEDVSNIIKNSLSSILNEPDNYNRVSFYA